LAKKKFEGLLRRELKLMGQNVWKFLRLEDGTYAVYHRGDRLAEGIHAEWREEQFCVRWGFCGEECREIIRQLDESGECTLIL
jgi:hypothetical protein